MSDHTIELSGCPVCGSVEHIYLFEGHDRLHSLPGYFPVVRCQICGTAYLKRRPIDVSAYYPTDSYAAYDIANKRRHYSRAFGRRYGLQRRCHLVETLKPNGGYLLDVGCGAGDFLEMLQNRSGWQVTGLEPNSAAAQYARNLRHLEVITGFLPQLAIPSHTYDIVTLWHVIEHVPDPKEVLNEIRRLLKPDGALIVALPVADSLEAKWFGPSWAGYDVPRHLMTFTRSSFVGLMRQSGLLAEERFGVVQGFASLRLSINFWVNSKNPTWRHAQILWEFFVLPSLFLLLRWRSQQKSSVAVFVAHSL
jgi:ubiquinone/menaquinone biosynthesis C-methylase UbiE